MPTPHLPASRSLPEPGGRALAVGKPHALAESAGFEAIFRLFLAVPADPRLAARDTAVTLARGLSAQVDGRLLLIDARLDTPAPKVVSDHPAERGLSDLLAEQSPWRESLAVPLEGNLAFLPRGSAPALAPAQTRARLSALLGELSSLYSVVVLLGGPVETSVSTRAIAGFAEKSLLLVREDDTTMHELDRSRELLLASLVPQVEVVLVKPTLTWSQRIFGPPCEAMGALASGVRRGVRAIGQRLSRLKSDQGARTTIPWPRRAPIEEANKGS